MKEFGARHEEVREVLKQLQAGYAERDLEKADAFVDELFVDGQDTYILGTGADELCLGNEEVRSLVKGDWEWWGDVTIDWENAQISTEGQVAWFATAGSVKYSFEHTPERYDSYVDFIKGKAEESGLSTKEKITFINWVLALTYHQREDKEREWLWPLNLSGVLLKDADKWKIVHLQFSIPKANFPDVRFENSEEARENYNKQNVTADQYESNRMDEELKDLLKGLETELAGQKDISRELMSKYFAEDSMPCVIGLDNKWHEGIDQVRRYFEGAGDSTLSLDKEHAIASKCGEVTWITVAGTLKQHFTEEQLAEHSLKEMERIFASGVDSREKLFAAHRSVAYALKEGATGEKHTCPVRLTAVVLKRNGGPVFHQMHFSFPSDWIFEGKLDSVKSTNIRDWK